MEYQKKDQTVEKKKILARYHKKIVNIRNDFIHKLTYKLINKNQVLVIEGLNIKEMMSRKKKEKLGKNIVDVSWG